MKFVGRKSKLEILVKFIIDKNHLNIEDKELRVKKEEILSDEKIDIAKSTLYKLVNENDFLLVKGENIVLNGYDEFIKTQEKYRMF